ncbi:MAG: LAGLIDADG family homing endonuclease [Patescibacteria group bacterium]
MISADYIVGLTDGEGCFYVNLRPPDKSLFRVNFSVETHFYIKMRADELKLLEKVKKFFGCGAIYLQKEKRLNHSVCYRFEINAQRDIHEVLIPFFDKHSLQSAKKKNYLIFRRIAVLFKNRDHLKPGEVVKEITKLKSQMNLGARRVRESRSLGGNAK